MKQKYSLLEKAHSIQNHFTDSRKQRKKDKEQRYREFLANPNRPLPSYETLAKWRNRLIIIGFCPLAEPLIQIFFFYESCFNVQIAWHIYFSMAALQLWIFAGVIDWCIYRRWGNGKSIIQW